MAAVEFPVVVPIRTDPGGKFQAKLNRIGQQTSRVETRMLGLKRAAAGLFAGLSAALLINELRKAFKASNDFEAALVGIGKTANLSTEELAELGDELDRLSRLPGMPQAEQLLEIGKVAGQLGVKGVADIAKFTETMAKLGSATDLVGEEGATALAKLLNITGESASEVDVLASVIVALGNEFATTESRIAFTAGEVARATAVFDIGSASAAAFATVLSAFGVRAELAGSATGRAFRVIESAVKSGGKEMAALARLSRVSAAEITEAFSRSPVEAFNLFLKGLRDVQAAGGNVAKELESVGLKGEEVLKVIPLLAKEFDTLARAQAIAAAETENATALEEEFAKSAAVRAASMSRLGNTLGTVARIVGGAFAPAIAAGADALADGLDAIIGWNKQGADLERLLDELAPSADTAAKAFKNLALEVERSAEAQKLLQLISTYNRLLDEQEKVASRLRGLSDENLAGVLGIKLQTRIDRIAEALGVLPEQIDEARAALANLGKEEEKVAEAGFAVAKSLEEIEKALEAQRRARLDAIQDFIDLAIAQKAVAEAEAFGPAQTITFKKADFLGDLGFPLILEELQTETVGTFTEMGRSFKDIMSDAAEEVGDNWQAILLDIFAIAQDFGRREQGRFGGNLTGDFASEGQQVGQLAGFIVGGVMGAQIGEIIGGVIGRAIQQGADEGLASLRQIGDDVAIQITANEGGLGGIARQIGEAFNAALAGVEDLLMGQIDIAGFDIKIRDDTIFLFINGITGIFDNIADAVDFALVESLKGATFFGAGPGASPEILAVLQNFAGDSIEILNMELAKAIQLQELRQGPIVTAAEAKAAELFDLLRFAIEKGIDTAGVVGAFGDLRAAALGFTQSAEEQRRAQIDAFNASIEVRIAELQAMAAVQEAEAAVTKGRLDGARLFVDSAFAATAAMGSFGAAMGDVAQIGIVSANLQSAAAQGIADAIAGLQAQLIGSAEAAAAIAAAGRRTSRRGGGSGRGAAREAFEDQITRLQLTTAGMEEAELAAAEFDLSISELRERMDAARFPAERQAELIGLLTTAEEQRIAALETALPALGASIEDLFGGAAGFLAGALGDQEILADLERLNFLERLEQLRTEFELLEARALLEGDLTDAQLAKLDILRDLFDQVGQNLPDILEGFSTTVEEAGQAFAAAVSTAIGASGFAPGTLADQAFNALQQLAQAQGNLAAANPFAAIEQRAQEFRDIFEPLAGVLGLFGTSIEEVRQQINDLRDAEIAQLFEPINQTIQNFVDSIRGGPLSGLSDRAQFDIAAQGIQDLIAQAASDDLETAFLARQQLAQQLASFAQLAQAGLLEGSVPFLDALADQLEALGLGGALGLVPDPGTLPDGVIGGADRFRQEDNSNLRSLLDEMRGLRADLTGREFGRIRDRDTRIRQEDQRNILFQEAGDVERVRRDSMTG